jgi:hypothetical protein
MGCVCVADAYYGGDLCERQRGWVDRGHWDVAGEAGAAWPGYKHHQTGEDNADAHLKALLLHHETTLPVTNGRLDLGTWQRVFYAEFDGQRAKRVIVKVLGVRRVVEVGVVAVAGEEFVVGADFGDAAWL